MSDVRKKWLISFIILLAVGALKNLYSFLQGNCSGDEKGMLVAPLLIWATATYGFAYEKRGDGWLAWLIVTIPLTVILTIFLLSVGFVYPVGMSGSVMYYVFYAFKIAATIWFWICCFAYRKENLQIKQIER